MEEAININTQCYCLNLRKASRAITQFFDRSLRGAGIRSTQFSILLTLASSDGKSITDMAEGLVMQRTTLTRNLKPLEKAGLITSLELGDRRTRGYALTDKGRLAVKKGTPLWRKAQIEVLEKVGEKRHAGFTKELIGLQGFINSEKEGK